MRFRPFVSYRTLRWASAAYMLGASSRSAPSGRNDGRAFEIGCANILRDRGWSVRMTPASGDQGVDIIARKKGRGVAIQAKDYACAVGNEAVQQVCAGQQYYRLDRAAVVAPNGYTNAARALAARTGVRLLCPDQLNVADSIFSVPDDGALKRRFDIAVAADRLARLPPPKGKLASIWRAFRIAWAASAIA